ncbi:hypothetical protein QTV37_003485 [Vibrio parahaemolyticus]|nr:hypothetical protein [Vibrio parahaemolyticus]
MKVIKLPMSDILETPRGYSFKLLGMKGAVEQFIEETLYYNGELDNDDCEFIKDVLDLYYESIQSTEEYQIHASGELTGRMFEQQYRESCKLIEHHLPGC